MNKEDIIENGLYKLNPKEGKILETWCRHNLLIASKEKGLFIFIDTYWGNGSINKIYKFDDIKDQIEFVFDMNFSEKVHKDVYEQYNQKDRFFIPIGGRGEKYLIDIRAKKSRKVIIKLLEDKIIKDQDNIVLIEHDIKLKEKILENVRADGNLDNIYI